ncbi:MAG: hypothetical protein FJX80_15380 [Bacteroidetes bacterium]|nr:hypothetical protein [Bacteroidota bacterium]
MLTFGKNNGVVLIPNPPKDRYIDEKTGAHFEFKEICIRLEKILKMRQDDSKKNGNLRVSKDFKTTLCHDKIEEQEGQENNPLSDVQTPKKKN